MYVIKNLCVHIYRYTHVYMYSNNPSRYPNSRERLLMFSPGKQTSVALGGRPYSLQELPVALVVVGSAA